MQYFRQIITISIFLSLFPIQAQAENEKLDAVLEQYFMTSYKDSFCQFNIRDLVRALRESGVSDLEDMHVVIAETTNNELAVGSEIEIFSYHVFLVDAKNRRVFDPLMKAMYGKHYTNAYDYFRLMFPSLTGTRFTSISARTYAQLDTTDIALLFRQYLAQEGVPHGSRKIVQAGQSWSTTTWRQGFEFFLTAIGLLVSRQTSFATLP